MPKPNEEKELQTTEQPAESPTEEKGLISGYGYIPPEVTDYDQLEAAREMEELADEFKENAMHFPKLVQNILYSEEPDKVGMFGKLANSFISMASKTFGSIGKGEDPEPEAGPDPAAGLGLYVWKGANGIYSWLARYSNNYEDREEEIISRESHLWFIDQVQKELAQYPELWLWHQKELAVGRATFLAWDEQKDGAGFAIAGGYFYPEAEPIAKAMSETEAEIFVSHGMPKVSIVRDGDNPKIIKRHITKEISPLPPRAAANEWTGFIAMSTNENKTDKESIMAIKKQIMTDEWGIDGNVLNSIEAQNKEIATKNAEEGIKTKELDSEAPAAAEEPKTEEPKAEEAPAVEPKTEPETDEEYLGQPATRKEVVEAVSAMEANLKEMFGEQMKNLGAEIVKSLANAQKEQAEEIKETLQKSPRSILNFLNKERATDSDVTKVKAGEDIKGPKQTEAGPMPADGGSDIPILGVIAKGQDWRKELVNQK